jgi:hypothetical protein
MNDASFGSKRMNRVSARLLAASTPNRSLNRTPLGGASRLGGHRLPWFVRPQYIDV